MTEAENKFNRLCESAFAQIKRKYESKFKFGNPLVNFIPNNEVYVELLKETTDKFSEIANLIYDDCERDVVLKLCQDKTRELLPEMKKLRGF